MMGTNPAADICALEERLRTANDAAERIDAANDLAWELREGDPERSKSLSEESYRLSTSGSFEKDPYARGLIMSLRGLAHASRRSGDFELGLSQSQAALEALKSLALPAVEIDILRNTAIILNALGSYPEALEYCYRALTTAESIQDQAREGSVRGSIGVIYVNSKNYSEADSILRKALTLHRRLGNRRDEGLTLNNLSVAARELGELDDAVATGREALRLAEQTEFKALIVTATGTVAEAYLAKGDYTNARSYLEEYLTKARAAGSKRDETWAYILRGELELEQDRLESAARFLSLGLELARGVGLRREESRCYDRLATVFERRGDLKSAVAHLREFTRVQETIFSEANARSMAHLRVLHGVETARKDAEISYLRTVQLQNEVAAHRLAESALEKLAATDPLTGVLNRRKFFALGEAAAAAARDDGQRLSAVLVDLDHFKDINDSYGHASGDVALTGVAEIIRGSLRKGEMLGRIGGDEFAVLLPESDESQATRIVRRIQKALTSRTFQFDGHTFLVEASFGVAQFDPKSDSGIDSLLNNADRAMYSAKRTGRNKVMVFRATRRRDPPQPQNPP